MKEFSFDGDRSVAPCNLVLAINARKILRHRCQGYLALVWDTSIEGTDVENVPIIKEFVNVFPEKLPGLRLDREIEFCIDIVLGTNSISMPPYRMAPAKLKELKEQL